MMIMMLLLLVVSHILVVVLIVHAEAVVVNVVIACFVIDVRFGYLVEHQILVLLLTPNIVGQARVGVIDAHGSAQVAFRVLDAFKFVHA